MSRATDRTKNLRALLAEHEAGAPDVLIADLTLDSRKVRLGAAFVALPGARTHGVAFVEQAVQAGAGAILWEPAPGVAPPAAPRGVCVVRVPDLTRKLGHIADRFFDEPSAAVRVIGVTGTNGKTTTAHVIAAALERLGEASAYAGTLGYGRIDALRAGAFTTPDCITV
ncbi:MAG TPA: Mur ligase domain-containing protein, partial [Steroidobacter sp.]|nr:Mur ligase domain-containing protein [Steroidobacter sp.]